MGINAVEIRKEPPKYLRTVASISSSHVTPVNEVKYQYMEPSSDDAIMHDMNPTIMRLNQLQVRDNGMVHHNEEEFDAPPRNAFISRERYSEMSAESLDESWGIGIKKAGATINATTQKFKRSAILPISRRYCADRFYNVKRLDGKFSTDTLWADVKPPNQHKYAQLFTHKCGFTAAYPMDSMLGDQIGSAMQDFIHDLSVPESLTFDGHMSQVGKNSLFMKTLRKYHVKYHISAKGA